MRSERSDLLLLSGGAQLCLWRMSCPSRAEARSSSSSGCAFGRGMRSGRVPGCGLEPAPRTLSPRNRVCTFYLSGIFRRLCERPQVWLASRLSTLISKLIIKCVGDLSVEAFELCIHASPRSKTFELGLRLSN